MKGDIHAMQTFVFSDLSLQVLDIYMMGLRVEQPVMANLPSQQVKMLSKSYIIFYAEFVSGISGRYSADTE